MVTSEGRHDYANGIDARTEPRFEPKLARDGVSRDDIVEIVEYLRPPTWMSDQEKYTRLSPEKNTVTLSAARQTTDMNTGILGVSQARKY